MMQVDDDRNPWLEAISQYKQTRQTVMVSSDEEEDEEMSVIEKETTNYQTQQPIQYQYYFNNHQPLSQHQSNDINDQEDVEMKPVQQPSQLSIMKLMGTLVLIITTLISLSFLTHFYTDVFYKIKQQSNQVNMKISACAKQYLLNSCSTITNTIPHMVSICNEWMECMQQDPEVVNRLSVFGQVLSDLVNGFIDPLSWKVVSVMTVWVIAGVYLGFQLFVSKIERKRDF